MPRLRCRFPLAFMALAGVFFAVCPAAGGFGVPLFRNLSVDDGLPENSAWDLCQDRLGFLWIATQNGLVRYDGYRFVTFKPDPSLRNGIRGRSIYAVAEGADSAIWVFNERGLERLDRRSGTFRLHPLDFPNTDDFRILRIFEDRRGRIWLFSRSGLLHRFDPLSGKFLSFRHDPRDPRSLAHSEVTTKDCFLETSRGEIWVGTRGGLHRLDPLADAFGRVPLGDGAGAMETITCLAESIASPGTLWVGTGSGRLLKVNGGAPAGRAALLEEHRLSATAGQAATTWVTGVLEDPRRGIWLTTTSGLFLVDRDGRARPIARAGPGNDPPYALVGPVIEDIDRRLWFRSMDLRTLFFFDPETGRLTRYTGDSGDPSGLRAGNGLMALLLDRSGVLWVGSWLGGLNRMDPTGENFRCLRHDPVRPDSLADDNVRSVLADPEGRLWVGTEGGLDRLDPDTGRCEHLRVAPDGPERSGNRLIRSLCAAPDRTLWIGTNGGLLNLDPASGRITRRLTRTRTTPDTEFLGLVDRLVRSPGPRAAITGAGNNLDETRSFTLPAETPVLVVCAGEAAPTLDDFGWLEDTGGRTLWQFSLRSSLHAGGAGRNRVDTAVLTLPGGTYRLRYRSNAVHSAAGWVEAPPERPGWWGIQVLPLDSASRESIRRLTREREDDSLSNDSVRALLADAWGHLWIGTANGLDRYNPRTGLLRHFRRQPEAPTSLSDDNITALLQDRAGFLWVGTNDGGLHRYDPLTESFQHYLPRRCVLSLFEDSAGRFWVGTYEEGLYLMDRRNGTWRNFSEKEGLSNDLVSGIQEDRKGFLWLATARGLSRFDPRTGTFRHFDVTDGITVNNRLFTLSKGPGGRLCAGGSRGLGLFDPDRMKDNPYPPAVVLTGFRLFGKSVAPSASGPLAADISLADEVRLSWEQNTLTFEFAALHYSSPARNRCRYQLENFDRAWIEAGPERMAHYTNLDPGTYTFRVQGCNGDGVWDLAGRSIRVVISPPFWKTIPAYLLYLAVALLLVVGTHHLRVWRLKRSEALLKRQVTIKTVELSQANTRLSRAKESLEKAMADLSASNAALEKANEVKGELLRMAAHDLKNPLTAIVGFTKLLRPKLAGEPKNRERLDIIGESADRMFHLITELLETAAIEDGRLVLNRVALDAGDLAAGAVEDARPAAGQKGQTLHFTAMGGCRVEADPGILRQVLDNLVGNAVKFSPPDKSIWVTVEREDGEVRIGVRDEGPGLTEDDRRKVFGKFQKLSARPTGGESSSGLGLSIVKGLVELHGGRIGVESEEGRGALFWVALPLAPAESHPSPPTPGT
ncbi:MAG: hypothetical protein KA419_15195 [Acidobacteria bacterium]|nr:hypothetical protein [Acidobacteriota bacterium]